jgi:hypothetical protein
MVRPYIYSLIANPYSVLPIPHLFFAEEAVDTL